MKYRNKPTVIDGRRFASKKEARRYLALRLLERAGEISSLACQVRYPLSVNGIKVCTYVADFVYRDKGGGDICEDVKGYRTTVFKLKKLLMFAIHGIKILET
jgi:hypothetical protein